MGIFSMFRKKKPQNSVVFASNIISEYDSTHELNCNDFVDGDLFIYNGEYRKLQLHMFDGVCKGIPITEEWLEENNFQKNHDKYLDSDAYVHTSGRIVIGTQYTNGLGDWYVHVDNEDMDSIGGIEVTYIHQLQQFLRLCNLKDVANSFV